MLKGIYNIIIKKQALRKKQKEIFAKTQVGDMLWCTMPLPKKELKGIEESHRTRPYLVVKKEKNILLCYQSTSRNREQLSNYEKYCVNSGKYKNKKTSWIDLTDIKKIKLKDIQLEFIKLTQIDIKKIEKRICIEKNRGNKKIITFNEPIYIEEGDVVIKDEKTYYVYSEDNVNIYCFQIQKRLNGAKKLKQIKINKRTYYTNFKEMKTIKRSEEMKVINIASREEMIQILEQKKILKNYTNINENIKRDKNQFEIGSVFQYGKSTVMYLYSNANKHYGVDLLWYSIKPRIFEIKEIQKKRLIGTKNLKEINKILETLNEKKAQNGETRKVYEYVRNLLFSSAV